MIYNYREMLELGHHYEGSHTADRGLQEYADLLGLTIRPCERILDVGASAGTFAKEVAETFGDETIVDSLDFFTLEEVTSGRISFVGKDNRKTEFYPHHRIVGDIAQGVRISDETYDSIVSLYAIPTWLNDYGSTARAFREMARLCKQNGEIRLFPMWIDNLGEYSGFGSPKNLSLTRAVFERHGYLFRLEEVVGSNGVPIEGARRIVINKTSSEIPSEEELLKQPFLERLVCALRSQE